MFQHYDPLARMKNSMAAGLYSLNLDVELRKLFPLVERVE